MKDLTSRHLMIFLLICLISEAVIMLFPSTLEWWHRSLVIPPIVVMALGAVYVMLMRKGKMQNMKCLAAYKVLKLIVVSLVVVLFVCLASAAKAQNIAFLMVSFLSYLFTLAAETWIFVKYQNNKTKGGQ